MIWRIWALFGLAYALIGVGRRLGRAEAGAVIAELASLVRGERS